jgi:hypothetical protein
MRFSQSRKGRALSWSGWMKPPNVFHDMTPNLALFLLNTIYGLFVKWTHL